LLNTAKILKMFRLDCISGNKPVFYFFILLIPFLGTTQQNLVPNASFEEYWQCPVGNDLNDGQFERCKYWWKPTMGTSDYYNSCNTGTVGVPNNFWGYQNAFHGNAYIGMVPIEFDVNGSYIGNEYIRTELLYPLKPCHTYQFRMYVSFANYSTIGVGDFGVWFSKENYFEPIFSFLEEEAQLVYDGMSIIDTLNWVKIEGNINATGSEKYLTIGYFKDNTESDSVFYQDFGFGRYAAYYIDSVSLIEIEEVKNCDLNLPNVFSPNNDGVNDFYDLSLFASFEEIDFSIINRWGNVITKLGLDQQVWNGTYLETECSEGVYFYKAFISGELKTGFIQLIR
jgi:gliding motility-associated-like protein